MQIHAPYLLFIGDIKDALSIKMAKTVADWRPDLVLGEYALQGCTVTTGVPQLDIASAKEKGAKSFLLGFTNSGGYLEEKYIPHLLEAIDAGLDIISGLHQRLESFPAIKALAKERQVQLIDVRHPVIKLRTGTGYKRQGKRLLAVGTDCSVGKMYSTMAVYKALLARSINCTYRATGQSGILVAGAGVAIDCVVSDFVAGVVEDLAHQNSEDHWDIIEGQGSLHHPAFAGVSLGLLHGAQPDALLLCHAENRSHMRGLPGRALPSIQESIDVNLMHAKLTNPNAKFVGICVNTSMLSEKESREVCDNYEQQFNLSCVDPLRHDVAPILANMLS